MLKEVEGLRHERFGRVLPHEALERLGQRVQVLVERIAEIAAAQGQAR